MEHIEHNRKVAASGPDSSLKSRDDMPDDYIDSLVLSLDPNLTRPPIAQHQKPLPIQDGGMVVHELASAPRSEIDEGMVVPALTRLLGFPLMVHPIGSIFQPVDNLYNQRAHLLFLEVDVNKKSFGTFATPPVMGNITVERCDGKSLKSPQLYSLIGFIDSQIGGVIRDWNTASTQRKHGLKAYLWSMLRPRTFYQFFEDQRGMPGFEMWEGVENPVQITEEERKKPICSACFVMGRPDGKPLLKCGACGKVAYCSKECQKSDWKQGHKLVCKKAGKQAA